MIKEKDYSGDISIIIGDEEVKCENGVQINDNKN